MLFPVPVQPDINIKFGTVDNWLGPTAMLLARFDRHKLHCKSNTTQKRVMYMIAVLVLLLSWCMSVSGKIDPPVCHGRSSSSGEFLEVTNAILAGVNVRPAKVRQYFWRFFEAFFETGR